MEDFKVFGTNAPMTSSVVVLVLRPQKKKTPGSRQLKLQSRLKQQKTPRVWLRDRLEMTQM